jgi:hypothetical protein
MATTSPPPSRLAARVRLAAAVILLAAFAGFVLSVSLWFSGEREEGIFVGLWVPSILALGAFAVSTLGATTRR